MKKMLQRVVMAPLLVAGLYAGQTLANELSGTLDGEQHEWHIVTSGGASTANFSEIMPGMVSVSVQGHRADRFETQGTLSISFMVMQGKASGASVSYFHESGLTPHYGTEEDVDIEIELLELDGDSGRAKGRVATPLAYVASLREEHDHTNTLDIDVSFDVELQREE